MSGEITLHIRRDLTEKMSKERYEDMLEFIGEKTRSRLEFSTRCSIAGQPCEPGGTYKWVFKATLKFASAGKAWGDQQTLDKVRERILESLRQTCVDAKFSKYPWQVTDENFSPIPEEELSDEHGPNSIVPFEKALLWDELQFDDSYIDMDDESLERTEAFGDLYERGAHIRLTLGAIHKAMETEGNVRNHVLLWGDPGAAKSGMLSAIQSILPREAWISLNVDSTTKAGFQTTFFNKLDLTGIPPIIFLEEMEKVASDGILSPLLSLLDTRAMIQQVNFRKSKSKFAKVLFIATANDKYSFDMMMGGRRQNGEVVPGALSSRFVHQLEVRRPSMETMRKILNREIRKFGGQTEFIEPAIELAEELGINDPRKIISFLDGGMRLLDGTYQRDMKMVTKVQKAQTDVYEDETINMSRYRQGIL